MHYPVMTEKYLADRWQVSAKALRRWRLGNAGPVWHKLFSHVRYREAASHYLTANEIAEVASWPIYLFRDQVKRNRK